MNVDDNAKDQPWVELKVYGLYGLFIGLIMLPVLTFIQHHSLLHDCHTKMRLNLCFCLGLFYFKQPTLLMCTHFVGVLFLPRWPRPPCAGVNYIAWIAAWEEANFPLPDRRQRWWWWRQLKKRWLITNFRWILAIEHHTTDRPTDDDAMLILFADVVRCILCVKDMDRLCFFYLLLVAYLMD